MSVWARIQDWRQDRAENRALPGDRAAYAAQAAEGTRARQEHEREVQEVYAGHGHDLDQEPGWVQLARQIEEDRERHARAEEAAYVTEQERRHAERMRLNEERRRQHPEVARAEDAFARRSQGQDARSDEERAWYREWAELDAERIDDALELQRREYELEAD